MCGIAGVCFTDRHRMPDRDVLIGMLDVLQHRGPDGEGVFLDEGVGLGHRRLSIIDIEGGSQPMYNEDGTVVIVFNGELYNYVELRPDLERRGHVFRTSSDTEVMLRLYEEYGCECLEKMNGMFAVAIWDRNVRSLFVARDRLGEKPVYYHADPKRLVFASELKSVLKDPSVPREISIPALDDYLAYGYVPGDRSIIKGVQKLPAGHYLLWREGKVEVRQYWQPMLEAQAVADEREWTEELVRRYREAVRIRLRSDVPLGVFLSGGVDSSATAAFAAMETTNQVKTFSVGFEDKKFNELPYARMVADRYDTDHTEIVVTDCNLSILPEIVSYLDEPFADPSTLPTFYICREARRHVTVCLSGDGGDEVFAGYHRYQIAAQHRRLEWLTRLGFSQLCRCLSSIVPSHVRGRGALDRIGSRGAQRYFFQVCCMTVEDRRKFFAGNLKDAVHEKPRLFDKNPWIGRNQDIVAALQEVDQRTYLPDDILVKVDRMAMCNSLEVRVPFLDHTLVEFCNRAPTDLKFRSGVQKYALKRMLEPYLPDEVLYRKKRGFGIPIQKWFKDKHVDLIDDVLLAPSARSDRFFDKGAVRRLVRAHRDGRRDLSRKIWTILVFELWCRKYGL